VALKREIKATLKQVGVSYFSVERTFFHSIRIQIRGFNDLLREKPSLFMLPRWPSVSVASLKICSIHLDFLAWIQMS
jgi:hypothetical protein